MYLVVIKRITWKVVQGKSQKNSIYSGACQSIKIIFSLSHLLLFILKAWMTALSQSKYIKKEKCKINIWSLTHESFFLYKASNFTLSQSEYKLLYYISNDSLSWWNHLWDFSEKSFFYTKLGLSTYQLWANLITDKKDYIQIVSKLVKVQVVQVIESMELIFSVSHFVILRAQITTLSQWKYYQL